MNKTWHLVFVTIQTFEMRDKLIHLYSFQKFVYMQPVIKSKHKLPKLATGLINYRWDLINELMVHNYFSI